MHKLDSIPAIDLNEIRKIKAESALDRLERFGVCDDAELGAEICRKQKFKLDSIPFDHGDYSGIAGPGKLFDSTKFDRDEFGGMPKTKFESSNIPRLTPGQ